jgi:hypothetical protein
MSSRPNMSARDSSGKKVSLLCDESQPSYPTYAPYDGNMRRSHSNGSGQSTASSPRTPDLLRSDSYDSQTANGPRSPLTPSLPPMMASLGRPYAPYYEKYEQQPYHDFPPMQQHHMGQSMRPQYGERRHSFAQDTYDEESMMRGDPSDKGLKRYPCRYRESQGCTKTFTTSGHASRHAKIHSAEKAVACEYAGCPKKFTRSDNMKQHLETHFKGKSGSSRKTVLTKPAGVQKPSSRPTSRHGRPELSPSLAYAQYPAGRYAMGSPTPLQMDAPPYPAQQIDPALPHRPMAAAAESSSEGLGLDLLAAACQSQQDSA